MTPHEYVHNDELSEFQGYQYYGVPFKILIILLWLLLQAPEHFHTRPNGRNYGLWSSVIWEIVNTYMINECYLFNQLSAHWGLGYIIRKPCLPHNLKEFNYRGSVLLDMHIMDHLFTGLLMILIVFFLDTAYMDYMDPDVLCPQKGR